MKNSNWFWAVFLRRTTFWTKKLDCKPEIKFIIKRVQTNDVAIARIILIWVEFCRRLLALLIICFNALGLVMRRGNIVISNIWWHLISKYCAMCHKVDTFIPKLIFYNWFLRVCTKRTCFASLVATIWSGPRLGKLGWEAAGPRSSKCH